MDFENRSVYAIYRYTAPDRSCHPTPKSDKKIVFRGALVSINKTHKKFPIFKTDNRL